ncbi:hypothetical protein Poli38472_000536 [Pythium oligandrum]|uniref:Elongation factor P n=1 Tax=Pythium oligandrum TaxID=41045 RepID=A0A8K1FGY8_PYTOL|nr:hypothetical protein Poli38472_000536 [Pythium oligandrum]|eukprot:TMW60494.1 hypothetical protein Poli38472_000536 [Pythium oligandrum]
MLRRLVTQAVRVNATTRASGVRFAHINGNQVRTGMALEIEGKIYRVTKSQHVKPGKGGAYVQCDLKEIKTGSKTNRRFRAAETVAKAPLGPDQYFQYLYQDGDKLVLMDNSSFEQLEVPQDLFSPRQLEFLVEGMTLSLQIVDGDVLWANMPEYLTLQVVETTAKGVADSALSVKDAKLSNGAVIKVPLYIENGHEVRVTTEDGTFMDKVN